MTESSRWSIPRYHGDPGFFTKYPTAAESPLCLSGYPRLPLREAISPSNRHCQEPAAVVVGRHFPIYIGCVPHPVTV